MQELLSAAEELVNRLDRGHNWTPQQRTSLSLMISKALQSVEQAAKGPSKSPRGNSSSSSDAAVHTGLVFTRLH